MRKQNSGRRLKCVVGFCASIALLAVTASPAPAQYLNYLPWSIGSSLLYPLRMFGGYSANGMSGYSNPLWYGGGVLNRMSRGSGGLGYGGYDANGNPNFYEINNDDPNSPNSVSPYNQNQTPPAVLRYGGPIYQPKSKKSRQNAQNTQNTAQNFQPNYSQSGYPSAANGQVAYGQPPQAGYSQPQAVGYPPGQPQAPFAPTAGVANVMPQAIGSAVSAPQQAAPFAVSFINTVNEKYDGDIRRALANPQTKAWASSLGLVNGAKLNLSEERVGVIGRILHDSTLDPVSKLEAIKILLRS